MQAGTLKTFGRNVARDFKLGEGRWGYVTSGCVGQVGRMCLVGICYVGCRFWSPFFSNAAKTNVRPIT
jgi:hypothetical protein